MCRKTVCPRLVKRCANTGRWDMHSFVGGGARLKEQSCWQGFFRTNCINAIVPKYCAPKTCQAVRKRSDTKGAQLLARFFQDKLHQCDCAEKLCAQDLSSGAQKERHEKCTAVGTIFSGQIASMRLCRRTVRPRLVKRCAKGATRKMRSCWHDFFRTNFINPIVPKNYRQSKKHINLWKWKIMKHFFVIIKIIIIRIMGW